MGIQSTGALGPITINTGAVPAQPTTTSALAFNLNSGTSMASITTPFSPATATSYAATYPVTAYDSLGNASTVQLYFVPTTPTTAGNPPDYAVYAIPQSPPATATAAPYTPIATMQFNQNGTLVPGAGVSTGTLPITWTNGAAPSNIAFTFTGTTLAAQSFAVAANATNGAPPGNYTGTTISTTGELHLHLQQWPNGELRHAGDRQLHQPGGADPDLGQSLHLQQHLRPTAHRPRPAPARPARSVAASWNSPTPPPRRCWCR